MEKIKKTLKLGNQTWQSYNTLLLLQPTMNIEENRSIKTKKV